ncbi:UNVERIFIED_CONTAM: phosphoesterase RecJ-like protein [Brevibacillus sp. OAP136]
MSKNDYQLALKAAGAFMHESERFLVISHVNPDGDTTSSVLACALMLEQLGKTYVIVNEGETPAKFGYLPRFSHIRNLQKDEVAERFSHVIAIDAADSKRMGKVRYLFNDDARILNIDHHPTNDEFGNVNVIRTDAAAAAEIMYEFAVANDFTLNPELAVCFYTGLLTDTGGFRYSNTSPNVLKIASELLQYGLKPGELAERCLEETTLEHMLLLRRSMQSLAITHRKQVASLKVTREDLQTTGASSEDAGGFVNHCRNIEGVEVGVSFFETEAGHVKVSLRSRSRVDVAEIAKQLGGGGHARAAGCTLTVSMDEAERVLYGKLREALGVDSDE